MAWKDMSDKWPLLDIVRHLNTNIRDLFDRRVKQASGSKTAGHFVSWDDKGDVKDSGSKADDFATAAHSHVGMITGTPGAPGNLASWNAAGDAVDSGANFSPWAAWNPVLGGATLGNGSIYAERRLFAGSCDIEFVFTLGSSSAITGDFSFTLPVNAKNVMRADAHLNAGGARYDAISVVSGGACYVRAANAAGTYLTQTNLGPGIPATWVAGATIVVKASFQTV